MHGCKFPGFSIIRIFHINTSENNFDISLNLT